LLLTWACYFDLLRPDLFDLFYLFSILRPGPWACFGPVLACYYFGLTLFSVLLFSVLGLGPDLTLT
jgi:hypothetical protein